MVRLELFANHSVENAILEQLFLTGCTHFTKIPLAHGEGSQVPKYGNDVWPETNFILIIYCEQDKIPGIKLAIKAVKTQFPLEGISLFCIEAEKIDY